MKKPIIVVSAEKECDPSGEHIATHIRVWRKSAPNEPQCMRLEVDDTITFTFKLTAGRDPDLAPIRWWKEVWTLLQAWWNAFK